MPILVLDLDETVMVNAEHAPNIDPIHSLGQPYRVGDQSLSIINPKELCALIDTAYQYDGIMVLTSGTWRKKDIIHLLQRSLMLSQRSYRKLNHLSFHSAETDVFYFLDTNLSLADNIRATMKVPKGLRLKKIIERHSIYQGKHFVALDDSRSHLKSYSILNNLTPILATTRIADKSFYQNAEHALAARDILESRSNLMSASKQAPLSMAEEIENYKKSAKKSGFFYNNSDLNPESSFNLQY